MWSSSRNLFLIRIFHESITVVEQSFKEILDLYILKDILQSDWFISFTNSRNSIWTVGMWHINPVIQQQGLVPDPEFFLIWDVGLLIISGNVSIIHHACHPQNWFIYYVNYFHTFKLSLGLLTYKPSEGEARTRSGSGFSPDPGQLSANHFWEC